MKWVNVVISMFGILAALGAGLQAATFSYVVSIERRLTRLETLQEAAKLEPRRQALEAAALKPAE
jgi:hypothetical protein